MKRSLNRWLAALLTACMLMTTPVALMEEALEGYVEEVVVELGEDIVIADGEALPAETETLEEVTPALTEPSDEIGEAAPAEEAEPEAAETIEEIPEEIMGASLTADGYMVEAGDCIDVQNVGGRCEVILGEEYELYLDEEQYAITSVKSNNRKVAAINNDGGIYVLSAQYLGTSTITISATDLVTGANSAKFVVKVTVVDPNAPSAIKLDQSALTLNAGEEAELTYTLEPEDATNILSWDTSDPGIAVVQGACVRGLRAGTATITVKTHNRLSASLTVTVTGSTDDLPEGLPITAQYFPDANFRNFIWRTCDWDCDGALSDEEIEGAQTLDIREGESFAGLEYLTALRELHFSDMELPNGVDLSKLSELTALEFHHAVLNSLDLSRNTKLERLWFEGAEESGLSALNLSKNTNLKYLNVAELPKLTKLDVSACPKLVSALSAEPTKEEDGSVHYTLILDDEDDEGVYELVVGEGVALTPKPTAVTLPIDASNFPDAAFRQYVQENFDENQNGSLNALELSRIEELFLYEGDTETPIQSIKGIEYFTNLRILDASFPTLTSLDVSKNTALTELFVCGTGIKALDVSKNVNLVTLFVLENSGLKALDISNNTELKMLDASYTGITSLNLSKNAALARLYVQSTGIKSLDISKNPLLIEATQNMLRVAPKGYYKYTLQHFEDVEVFAEDGEAYVQTRAIIDAELAVDKGTTITPKPTAIIVEINATNFPDPAFRNYISENFDPDGTGYLYNDALMSEEIWFDEEDEENPVTSLKGIEFFKNLKVLNASMHPKLTAIDVSKNTQLESLYVNDCDLASLNVDNNPQLSELFVQQNPRLTKVNVSACPNLVEAMDHEPEEEEDYALNYQGDSGYVKVGFNTKVSTVDDTPVDPTAIILHTEEEEDVILSDGSYEIEWHLEPHNGVSDVTWKSSDTKTATVANGVVKFLKAGDVTITATTKKGNRTAQVKLHIVDDTLPTGVSIVTDALDEEDDGFVVGLGKGTLTLSATLEPEETAKSDVTWASSNSKAATIDKNGKLTLKAEGWTNITVTTNRASKKDTIRLHVFDNTVPTAVEIDTDELEQEDEGFVIGLNKKTFKLSAVMEPEETAKSDLTWKSSNTKAATIDKNGKLTLKAEGVTTVSVTTKRGGKTASFKLHVLDNTMPTAVAISRDGLDAEGEGYVIGLNKKTFKLSAVMEPSTASSALTWKSSNTKAATVDKNGKLTLKAEGVTTITVTTKRGSKVDSFKLHVLDNTMPTAVAISRDGLDAEGEGYVIGLNERTFKLNAVMEPATASSALTWKSSNKKAATIDSKSGKLTLKGEGVTTITVTTKRGSKVDSFKLHVYDNTIPTALTIASAGNATEVEKGKTLQLSISAVEPSTAVKTVTWKSANSKVASVSKSGLVKGVKPGTVKITATSTKNKKIVAEFTVTVK